MSFSGTVKEELYGVIPQARHCRLAELAAIIGFAGEIGFGAGGRMMIMIRSDNRFIIKKASALIFRLIGECQEVSVTTGKGRKGRTYLLAVTNRNYAAKLLTDTGFLTRRGVLRDFLMPPDEKIVKKNCCMRAYLRGALLAAGTVSDPAKSYHLEFTCQSEELAEEIRRLLSEFDITSRITVRKQSYIVYIKDGDGIADTLNLTGAHKSLLEMENVRILKGISGRINRSVNCETANLGKMVSASVEQVKSIERIRDTIGLDALPPALREMAAVRLENRELPLKDLGALLDPPVGKSGVNHRLRKLKQIADEL